MIKKFIKYFVIGLAFASASFVFHGLVANAKSLIYAPNIGGPYFVSGTDSNVYVDKELYGGYYRFSTSTQFSINKPHTFVFFFDNLNTYAKDYDYFYIYGYANYSIMSAQTSIGVCENIANSSSYFGTPTDEKVVRTLLVPYAFKCSLTEHITNIQMSLMGSAFVNYGDTFYPTVYLSRWIYFADDSSATGVEGVFKEQTDRVVSSMDEMNKTQQETNEKLDELNDTLKDDSIDTSSSNSFFNDFSTSDNGGISGVVTAPLSFIRSLTGKCQPLEIPIFDTTITLPCGDTLFWGREDVKTFRTTWNVLLGGLIIYKLIVKLFEVIHNLKDPDNSKVEVMKL